MTDGNTYAINKHLNDHEDWDALQEVTVELEQAESDNILLVVRIEELEAKLRSMALDYLASEGQAQMAYQAQLELEAKLDKAMKLIEYAIELGRWDLNPSLRDDLIDFSAELKGETDE